MTDQETARIDIALRNDKIARVIKYIATTHIENGRLPESDQHCIRILRSRQREFDRLFNRRYGTDPDKYRAEIELSIDSRDRGDLIELYGKSHGVGRLGCGSCAYKYVQVNNQQVQVSLSKLCTICGKGIMHACKTAVESSTTDQPELSLVVRDGMVKIESTGLEIPRSNMQIRLTFVCDNCLEEQEGEIK